MRRKVVQIGRLSNEACMLRECATCPRTVRIRAEAYFENSHFGGSRLDQYVLTGQYQFVPERCRHRFAPRMPCWRRSQIPAVVEVVLNIAKDDPKKLRWLRLAEK